MLFRALQRGHLNRILVKVNEFEFKVGFEVGLEVEPEALRGVVLGVERVEKVERIGVEAEV